MRFRIRLCCLDGLDGEKKLSAVGCVEVDGVKRSRDLGRDSNKSSGGRGRRCHGERNECAQQSRRVMVVFGSCASRSERHLSSSKECQCQSSSVGNVAEEAGTEWGRFQPIASALGPTRRTAFGVSLSVRVSCSGDSWWRWKVTSDHRAEM